MPQSHVLLHKQMHLRSQKLFLPISLVREEKSCDGNPKELCLKCDRGSPAPLTLLLQPDPPPGPLFGCHKRKSERFLDITIKKAEQNITQKPKNTCDGEAFPSHKHCNKTKSHLCKHFYLKKESYCQVSKSVLFIQTSGCEQFCCHIPLPNTEG